MKVFKFGGASVKSAEAIENVANIIEQYRDPQQLVVVSALGKTTNALEEVTEFFFQKDQERAFNKISEIKDYHYYIADQLFESREDAVYAELGVLFRELINTPKLITTGNYNFLYDQTVSLGELIATTLIANYLNKRGITTYWLDARTVVKTDATYRDARIDWETTQGLINDKVKPKLANKLVITQGFIGSNSSNHTTTLGREGSDFTAAIFSYCLEATEMSVWKDVPGVLNADPKWFDDTELLKRISYREAIELSYYGASIIHPKTIKPLQNKNIPLRVRSFVHPEEEGTVIGQASEMDTLIPSFIFRVNQVLISISAKDFSFVVEENLSEIFGIFHDLGVKIALMQNSAIRFSVCCDNDKMKIPALINMLEKKYWVRYTEGLELITIRHYDQPTLDRVLPEKEILVTQTNDTTARYVARPIN